MSVEKTKCPVCDGEGKYQLRFGKDLQWVKCQRCEGTGQTAKTVERKEHPWKPIKTLPRDGTPVLVWAPDMSRPDIAWHESTLATLQTYTHWMPLPEPPNASNSATGDRGASPAKADGKA